MKAIFLFGGENEDVAFYRIGGLSNITKDAPPRLFVRAVKEMSCLLYDKEPIDEEFHVIEQAEFILLCKDGDYAVYRRETK